MSKFKFSEKERKELDDLISNVLEYKGDREYFIGEIESILSAPSEPAETGGAEEILEPFRCVLWPHETMGTQYKPDAYVLFVDAIKAMTTYAAKRCAEKDREIKELRQQYHTSERHRLEDAASAIADQGFQYDRIKYLHSELTKSNAHRSRLIESVKKWGGAWRKCRAELKEAKRRIAELEEQNKDNNFLLNEIDAWFSFNNQPSVKEIASMRKSIQEKMK